MRGKKSRTASPFAEATVERTLVFSMVKTTAPFAKRANFPVSSVITREPISNCSVKMSRCFVVVVAPAEPRRPEQMVRKRKPRRVRKCGGSLRRSGFALLILEW